MVVRVFLGSLAAFAAFGATGEVVFLGSVIGSPGSYGTSGSIVQKAFDGDVNSIWAAADPSDGWAGMDMGLGVTMTRYRVAPMPGDEYDHSGRLYGLRVQGSNTPDFSRDVAELDTIPSGFYVFQHRYGERTVSASSRYRYLRVLSAQGAYGSVAELQFIGLPDEQIRAKPVMPTFAPWGGKYPELEAPVSMASLTTSARIYYTTDGSTPTNFNGTLYSGSFMLPMTRNVTATLKAIAYDPTLSTALSDVSTAYFAGYGFKPNDDWYDDAGYTTQAFGGGIAGPVGGRYYWVGMAVDCGGAASGETPGIWLYSSSDLYNWKNEGQMLAKPAGVGAMTRVHVLYNQATGKYVLWAHLAAGEAGIATANGITGPWTWQPQSTNPDGLGLKDFNLFQDDDGTAYVVYTDGPQQNIVVSKLAADYLGTTASISDRVQAQTGTQREAPVMFKRGRVYFLITSTMNYYNPGLTYNVTYQTASAPLGTWSAQKGLYESDPLGTDFNAQPSFVFSVPERREGSSLRSDDRTQDPQLAAFRQVREQYFLGSDYWNQNPGLSASRQVWLPLSFPSALTVVADTPAVWDFAAWSSRTRQRAR